MDFATTFERLEQRAAKAKTGAKAAATESHDKVGRRIDETGEVFELGFEGLGREIRANADSVEREADRAQGKRAQMKADFATRRDEVKARIQQRTRDIDAKIAAREADRAEAGAREALDYAAWAVETAWLAVLDAIDARAHAIERAREAASA